MAVHTECTYVHMELNPIWLGTQLDIIRLLQVLCQTLSKSRELFSKLFAK